MGWLRAGRRLSGAGQAADPRRAARKRPRRRLGACHHAPPGDLIRAFSAHAGPASATGTASHGPARPAPTQRARAARKRPRERLGACDHPPSDAPIDALSPRALAARLPGAPSASAAGTASHGPALPAPTRRARAPRKRPRERPKACDHPPSDAPIDALPPRALVKPPRQPARTLRTDTHPASPRGEKAPEKAPGGVRSPTLRRPHRRSPAAPPMPALAPPPRARTRASHARTRASHARTHAAPARPTPTRDPTTPQPRTRAHQRRAQPPPPGPFRCRSPRRARMGT